MKAILTSLILLIMVSLNTLSNINIQGKEYALGNSFDVYNLKEHYTLNKIKERTFQEQFYIHFKDSTFRIYEFTDCGMQCKRQVTGNYEINKETLVFSNILISANLFCKDSGTYQINQKIYFDIKEEEKSLSISHIKHYYNNLLKGKKYSSIGVPFEKKSREKYTFSIPEKTQIWGNFIEFHDSTFVTYYRASCGNDCFTSVKGKYSVNDNKLHIYVEAVEKNGMCLDPKDYDLGDYGDFEMTISADNIKLLKIN